MEKLISSLRNYEISPEEDFFIVEFVSFHPLGKGSRLTEFIPDYVDTLPKKLLKFLFPGFEVIDCQTVRNGHPDFIVQKGEAILYIEVKSGVCCDTLSPLQKEWFKKNYKDKNTYVLNIIGVPSKWIGNRTRKSLTELVKPMREIEEEKAQDEFFEMMFENKEGSPNSY